MRLFNTFGALALSALAALALLAPKVHAQTYSNNAAINFASSGTDGRATLYPSPIAVSGAPTAIGYLSVTLSGFSHTFVTDVNVLLVSPTGQKIILMANTNVSGAAVNNSLTFIPDGTVSLPDESRDVVSGLYACSVYGTPTPPAPAPAGPYGTSLVPLIGTSANGTWNLYVWDDFAFSDNGTFAGGWSIGFSSTPPGPVATAFTYQGLLSAGNAPVNGNANVRFTLCNDETVPPTISAVATPITKSLTGIQNGLVMTALDFGTAIDSAQARWLDIEVESPPGSGFVTLSPRQPITPTPQGRIAQRAVTADVATTATTAGQLVPGRARIRGDAGPSNGSPGIWFTSPIASPIERSFIGHRDDNNVGFYNSGWRLLVHNNGNIAIGNDSGVAPTQRLVVSGNVLANNIAVPSSGRFKHNVLPMTDALDKLLKLDGVTFDWNPDFAKDRPGREHDLGFVAEDVAKVFPEVVFFDADGNVTGMDYSRLTAVAVQAIKQQQAKFDAERQSDRVKFETQLNSLKADAAQRDAEATKRDAENAELKARLAAIEAALSKMTQSNK